jgi:ribosomal protein L37E
MVALKTGANEQEMKCPKCGWHTLHGSEAGVKCKTCGYELSPGEATKFRLYQMLKTEEKRGRK